MEIGSLQRLTHLGTKPATALSRTILLHGGFPYAEFHTSRQQWREVITVHPAVSEFEPTVEMEFDHSSLVQLELVPGCWLV
jgi:hypothetical protein